VAHQQLILRRFQLPEGFRVGAGVSEVQAAFVTTLAGWIIPDVPRHW
jgi:hypothetical protein